MSKQRQIAIERDPRWLDKVIARRPAGERAALKKIASVSRLDSDFQARLIETIRYFEKLSDPARSELWRQLFPRLAVHVESAWRDASERPFQVGYVTYPFRAPRNESVISGNRAEFTMVLIDYLRGLDPDAGTLAAWLPALTQCYTRGWIGWLLARIMNAGGTDAGAVRAVLLESIHATGESGTITSEAIGALLNSNQRDDWEAVGKLLLAAQRQEGLRQAIMVPASDARPEAFRYILGLIAEHDLDRFSSTVQSFDLWLGMRWAGGSAKVVRDGVRKLIEFLDSPRRREAACRGDDPQEAYFALWTTALHDTDEALRFAQPLLHHPSAELGFVAQQIIARSGLIDESLEMISERLQVEPQLDPRVLMAIAEFFATIEFVHVPPELSKRMFEIFESLPPRPKKLDPIVWPWAQYSLDRRAFGEALCALCAGNPEALIPIAPSLSAWKCSQTIERIAGIGEEWKFDQSRPRTRRKLTPVARRTIISLLADSRRQVQDAAFRAMADLPLEEDEVEQLTGVLHRSSGPLRANAIGRLLKLPDPRALRIARDLIESSDFKKRSAGIELAGHMINAGRASDQVRSVFAELRELITDSEHAVMLEAVMKSSGAATQDDPYLGLILSEQLASPSKPRYVGIRLETQAATRCLEQLAALALEHAEREIEVVYESSRSRELFGAAGFKFPRPRDNPDPGGLPLAEVWTGWLERRSRETRDPDGLELVRAWAWANRGESYKAVLPESFSNNWELCITFSAILDWIILLGRPVGGARLLVAHAEDALASEQKSRQEQDDLRHWSHSSFLRAHLAERYCILNPADAPAAIRAGFAVRMLQAMRNNPADRPSLEAVVCAYDEKLISEADFIAYLLHPIKQLYTDNYHYGPIQHVCRMRPASELAERPGLLEAARRVRQRLIEVELTRGEQMNAASLPATQLPYAGGADALFRLLMALGRDKFVRHSEWGEPSRAYSFSRLISVTAPGEGDDPSRFAELARASGVADVRMLETALFAPQWAGHFESLLGFSGLAEAAWWIHAHTKERNYWRTEDFRNIWAAQIGRCTELEADDLEDGAVDVSWFRRVIEQVGLDRWSRIEKAAKYASHSGGHKRATLFADAMLGRVAPEQLLTRIRDKRHQDAVRALGLLALPDTPARATDETLRRYQELMEFKRQSRKFGSQRQASEGRAVDVGLQNLARTAGYRDPQRLAWAMEREAVADLADGTIILEFDETRLQLAIDDQGQPEFTVEKKGRRLANVPAALRKNPAVAEMRGRVSDLRRQISRMRLSLEESMCRGDSFSRDELRDLIAHPLLRPMLERLVFVGAGDLIGYLAEQGRVLRDHRGRLEPIGANDFLRLAHPIDLLSRGDWSAWQRDCFECERVQPFKQVFRELYPKTAAELDHCDMTLRYAGHQVNPRQALALLKTRKWLVVPEEGVSRTYHDEGLIAQLAFQEHFYTPAEVDGLTLEGVVFVGRKEPHRWIALSDVPDRLFSEVMRDVDLVVSVAHAGGVDPEASASTIEMRSRLIDETSRLLKLDNVRVDSNHVRIDGKLASYSVHLGSAMAHALPGRALLIVAVHSQYRGRLFLPFADNDPRTAEVLAKTLLLARDEEIKDPAILAQIRG